jgi:two-component system response regulator
MPTTDVPLLQVLVVDDDLGDVALMENAFAEHSIRSRLHHAADGVQALAFLRRQRPYQNVPRPDLILLDLNMPRVDGRQVLHEIKTDDDLKAIPTIVLTTSSSMTDIAASYDAHANAYVTKPINLDEFDRIVIEIRNFYGHTAILPGRASDAASC